MHAFELIEASRAHLVELPQAPPEALAAPVRRLIVCTKAYDALPAVSGLRLDPAAAVLLMQNGMGSQQAVAEALPGRSVYAASSTEAANRPTPGRLVHAAAGLTRIGRLTGGEFDWVALLRRAGLAAEQVEPIEPVLLDKLRVNALINPLSVLHDCRNGELLERAQSELRALGAEADAVLAAAGHEFPLDAFEAARRVAEATADNVSSMLADARAGRRLELGYISGWLIEQARRHGVPAPSHEALYHRLSGGSSK